MKNFIIGYGETLTRKVKIKNGSGPKNDPYTIEEARSRFVRNLTNVIDLVADKPKSSCANNEIVTKFIQHPSYLAKTYSPKKLIEKFGMKDVGSRSVRIKPEKWAVQKHPEFGLSACIYVSGTREQYQDMLRSVASDDLSLTLLKQIQTIESISTFDGAEKIKGITAEGNELYLEVVLHASKLDTSILTAFEKYLKLLGGTEDKSKMKHVGGLTFVPVKLTSGRQSALAEFSHLRVLRSVPKLRLNKPDVVRTTIKKPFSLPEQPAVDGNIKVCIFDGGLCSPNLLQAWVNEIIPDDVSSTHPDLISHGSEVCSTYLFGPANSNNITLPRPYTNVDVIRVLSPHDTDPDLFDVLTRIENVLKEQKYKFANISLGPRIPIDDDDVHVWTSVLDSLLQDGKCLATVAVGNDGDLGGVDARIQPPGDMVNSFSIGSTNSDDDDWNRASYSCVGPGRSPGLIKPDGVMFGGDASNLFNVYSPHTNSIIGTMGTSYSAPYALRVAAGIDAITDLDLKPSTIKALMIHKAAKGDHEQAHVGWGKLPNSPESVVECLDDEAIIVYQGQLEQSEHLRIPIPLPDNLSCKWVHVKATFSINCPIDPEHPLNYTRAGLEITFRTNSSKFNDDAEHAKSTSFFSNSKLFKSELELREDAHKWETCLSQSQRFKRTTLSEPMFDVKYHARVQGAAPDESQEPINYSLIISLRAEGDNSIYNSILQQNRTLQPVKLVQRIET